MGSIGPNINPNFLQPKPNQAAGAAAPAEAALPASIASGSPGMPSSILAGGLSPALLAQAGMTPEQLGLLLRNLLQLPKEISQLMAMLAGTEGAITQEVLKALVQENPKILLEQLQTLFKDNKELQGKLFKLLQGNPAMEIAARQSMGELLQAVSELVAKAGNSPTEALQMTIALYLPWYPLEAPQRFHMHFEQLESGGESEESGNEGDFQLVLLLDTLQLGGFKVVIGLLNQTQLQLIVEHEGQAAEALAAIEGRFKRDGLLANLPEPQFIYQPRTSRKIADSPTTPETTSGEPTEKAQSMAVHPIGGVSFIVIHAAYLLSRLIFETDKRGAAS